MTISSTLNLIGDVQMAPVTYKVKVPELAESLHLGAMDLVRICGIAVGTAYKAINKAYSFEVSLDSCWKIYKGLRDNGIKINGRDLQWDDIVEFGE